MLGDDAVPLVTAALPSLMVTYHWPPLSPERLNWIVEFMPLAASAFKLAGISLKISSGVMRAPPLGWGVDAGVLGHAYTRVKNMGEHARRAPHRNGCESIPAPVDIQRAPLAPPGSAHPWRPNGTRSQDSPGHGRRVRRTRSARHPRARDPRVRARSRDLVQRRRGRRPRRHGDQDRRPVPVFSLDTGRLHPETYQFLEKVREHYRIPVEVFFPQPEAVERLVREKGLFSFYKDGHKECCGIRKVEPLVRALRPLKAWVTGQRRDQSPGTRAEVPVVQLDPSFGSPERPLVKFNPLANWSSKQVWAYIREHEVPYNALHERGFFSIGCEPCTRPINPGQHEREGRWWWEEETLKECGLHAGNVPPPR